MAVINESLRAQKQRIGMFARTAEMHLASAKDILFKINVGVDSVEELKEDVVQSQAHVEGSLNRLEDLDQWIKEEIEKDPETASKEEVVATYTQRLKEHAEKKNFGKLIVYLKFISRELQKVIDEHEEWEPMAPTPRESLEEMDDSWEHEELNESGKPLNRSDLREMINDGVAEQWNMMIPPVSMQPRMNEEMVMAELGEIQRKVEMMGEKDKEIKEMKEKVLEMETLKSKVAKMELEKGGVGGTNGTKVETPTDEKEGMNEDKVKKVEKKKVEPADSSDSEDSEKESSEEENGGLTESADESEDEKPKSGRTKRYLRLKLQEVPKFDGSDNMVYEEFRTTFMEGYHKNPDLNSVTKLIQLKGCLSGLAKEMLGGLQLTSGNYKVAWQILDQNFRHMAKPESELEEKFRNMKIHQKDYKQMKMDMAKITAVVYDMQNRGIDVNKPYIYNPLIRKFPAHISEQLTIKTLGSKFNGEFCKLRKWINKILSSKIVIQKLKSEGTKTSDFDVGNEVNKVEEKKGNGGKKFRKGGPSGFRGEGKNDQGENEKKTAKCIFHSGNEDTNHLLWKCPKSPHEKTNIVREQRRCYICFADNHIAPFCNNQKYRCQKCDGAHNKMLHFEQPNYAPGTHGFRIQNGGNFPRAQSNSDPAGGSGAAASGGSFVQTLNAPEGAKMPTGKSVGESNNIRTQESNEESGNETSELPRSREKEAKGHTKEREIGQEEDAETSVFSSQDDSKGQMAYILLKTDEGKNLIGLIDTGANCCLISNQSAQKNSLEVESTVQMKLKGIGSNECFETNLYKITVNGQIFTTKGYDKLDSIAHIQQLSVKELKAIKDLGIDTTLLKKLNHCDGKKIDMIIGTNVLWQLLKRAKIRQISANKSVVNTELGVFVIPTTIGDGDKDNEEEVYTGEDSVAPDSCTEDSAEEEDWATAIEKLWTLNVLGLQTPEQVKEEMTEIEEAMAEFKRTVKWESGKLLVKLPMNGSEVHLDDNWPVAKKRLINQMYKLASNEEAVLEYQETIRKQEEAGFIEKCDSTPPKGKCFYIPQQAVFKTDSNTTKMRIVLDASSHASGKLSLNQCIKTMPSMVKLLTGILLRGRTGKYYMTSDIEKAFHQIRLQEEDRDYTRFIWLKDVAKGPVEGNFVTYRFTRIPFGMSCSPFLLAASILTYMEEYPAQINQQMENNMYVDNLMFLTNNEEELPELYRSSKKAAETWGMNLRQYQSNSMQINEIIPMEDRAPDKPNKMLGMLFDARKDTMTLTIPKPPDGRPTKKMLQSFLARIYDPMGVLAPLTVRLKQFLQSLWTTKIGWKQAIPKETMPIWEAIKKEYQHTEYTMKRQLTERYDYTSSKLIIFSDASKNNYGVAAYIRFSFPDNTTKTSLLMSKSRVKPLKGGERLTIPRLELLALALATNCALYIKTEIHSSIPFESVEFFSDSMIALGWTTTKKTLKCFVSNKVKLIKDNCKMLGDMGIDHKLHYVPTEQNPADFLTRGKSSTELIQSELWHNGSEFLAKPEHSWPQQWKDTTTIPKWLAKAIAEEVIGKEGKLIYEEEDGVEEYVVNLTTATEQDASTEFSTFVPYESTNSLFKLKRYVETVMKAIKKKTNGREWKNKIVEKFMSAKEGIEGFEQRRKAILYYLIVDHYKDTSSQMEYRIPQDLNPVQDQYGLIRHGTRLANADVPTSAKYPIILIREHKLTEMIVRDLHVRNRHIGTEQLVAECRRTYWIPKCRQLARKVIHTCVQCRKLRGRPFKYPDIPPLPSERVKRSRPFQHIGIDYFGPIYYTGAHDKRKCWVLICTCLVTRNIHLELVSDSGTVEFMLAMRRFFSRRGTPRSVVLDNAKTFVLGEKIFNGDIRRMAEEGETFTNFLDQHPMEWKFITPLSPWKGGVYERLIGIVKRLLYSSGDTAKFNFVQLFTVITEIEGIVNSRPISHNSEKFVDGPVIRPVDFIIPEVTLGVLHDIGESEIVDGSNTEKIARAHMAAMNKHLNDQWIDWEDKFLLQLKEASNRMKHYSITVPTVGQVVLMEEKLQLRHTWPLARIVKTHPNKLGEIRTVTIKCNGNELLRSVNQLIPLELDLGNTVRPETETQKKPIETTEPPINDFQSEDAPTDTTPTIAQSKSPEIRYESEEEDPVETEDVTENYRTRPYLHRKAKSNVRYCELAEEISERRQEDERIETEGIGITQHLDQSTQIKK